MLLSCLRICGNCLHRGPKSSYICSVLASCSSGIFIATWRSLADNVGKLHVKDLSEILIKVNAF